MAPKDETMTIEIESAKRASRLSLIERHVVRIKFPFVHSRLGVADGHGGSVPVAMQERGNSTSIRPLQVPTIWAARMPGKKSQTRMMRKAAKLAAEDPQRHLFET